MKFAVALLVALLASACVSADPIRSPEKRSYAYRARTTSASASWSRPAAVPTRGPSSHSYAAPRPARFTPPPAARPGTGYYRLRGSIEIHRASCSRVQRSARDGAVSANSGDGPPCFLCRKSEALSWSR